MMMIYCTGKCALEAVSDYDINEYHNPNGQSVC